MCTSLSYNQCTLTHANSGLFTLATLTTKPNTKAGHSKLLFVTGDSYNKSNQFYMKTDKRES